MFYCNLLSKSLVVLTLLCLSNTLQANYCDAVLNQRLDYINRYKKIAVSEMERTGIPASIKLAQGILESANGQSELARKANNHFGIKCGGDWKGKTYHIKDDDKNKWGRTVKSCFRVYENGDQSYYAHSQFLANPAKSSRYGFLFSYQSTDYKKWAKGLKKAGYATNPKYPDLLINLIERHNLHKFDKMKSELIDIPVVVRPNDEDKSKENDDFFETSEETTSDRTTKIGSLSKITYHNDIKSILVKSASTPKEISQKYNISLQNLLKYNEISENIDLKAGTRIYLQPKRSSYRGKEYYHQVRKRENMFFIGQLYGVRMDKLYKRNLLEKGEEPAIGEIILLRGKAKNKPKLNTGGSHFKENKPTVKPTNKPKTTTKTRPNKDNTTTQAKSSAAADAKVVHVVKAGETLYRISKEYGVSIADILKINELSSNTVRIGQELIIKR